MIYRLCLCLNKPASERLLKSVHSATLGQKVTVIDRIDIWLEVSELDLYTVVSNSMNKYMLDLKKVRILFLDL